MKKPKSKSAREFVDSLPYEGEYFQPDDRIYLKAEMDKYIKYLMEPTREGRCKCVLWSHQNYPWAHDKDCPKYRCR